MPEPPQRLALFLRCLVGGGAERVMINLAQGFAQRGLKVDLVLAAAGGVYLSEVPPEVRVVDLKATWLPHSLPRLAHYLQQERPTALLAALHYPCEIALWAKRLARVPTRVVVSEHNMLSLESQRCAELSARLTPLAARLFYGWADGIVSVSHGVAQDLAQITRLKPECIRVIYNPILTPELQARAREPLDHPWFAPDQPPVIMGVGRLRSQKDFPLLIRAFAQVRRSRPARLLILGSGPEKSHLLELARQLGVQADVSLPGFVQNPYAYLARAAVFALSSAWEGFGNVLVEALAVGVPVVSTDCESGPAEILDGGRYGRLVPVGDSEAMAEAILSVLAGQTQPVDSAWLTQFSLEAAVEHYLQVLGVAPP